MSLVDLASSRYGGEVVWCSDEFFAAAANLVDPASPVWKEGEFTDRGKWMDGWETRRRRGEGHDSCVIRLGLPGSIQSVTVDTTHFTGNYPESFSLDGCGIDPDHVEEAEWVEIVPRTALEGDTIATLDVNDRHRVTHVRLNIFPDGGVARLRVEGEPIPSQQQVCPDGGVVDLALATLGGRCEQVSDAHFSAPANLVSPTEPEGIWDGWETARRRGPGHDWAVLALGLPGTVHAVDVDTRHFKGNAPGWVHLDTSREGSEWQAVCEKVPVEADRVNRIDLPEPVPADRIRLNIHPDGGVARLRVWGRPLAEAAQVARVRYLNSLLPPAAFAFFRTACGSRRWIEEMVSGLPYPDTSSVLPTAEGAFEKLADDDWREAFSAHPRIGERRGRQDEKGEAMSRTEQAGVQSAGEVLSRKLADANRRYEERFGFPYIVRGAGRSGEEMLELALSRLENDPEEELEVAAGQQREITMLRLRRLLCLEQEER